MKIIASVLLSEDQKIQSFGNHIFLISIGKMDKYLYVEQKTIRILYNNKYSRLILSYLSLSFY